jgi:GNAT superfamily N-acetyltransferase
MNASASPRIRPATPADLDALIPLIRTLFALEPDYPFDPDKVRRGLTLLLAMPDLAGVWVVDQQGAVLGLCSAQIVISTAEGGPSAWVEDLVIHPQARGRGLGRALMAAVSAWARERGVTRLQLLADRDNAPALGFYQHLGWQPLRMISLRHRPGAPHD